MALWDRVVRRIPLALGDTIPEVDARTLAAWLDAPPTRGEARRVQLVDVRTELEWRTSRIPGALHAPLPRLERGLEALALDPAALVVCICLSAHRSIPAVRVLKSAGFAEARQLAGGMLAWWAAGLPTESGEAETAGGAR
jgi:rhodanese-related sulfurtransferase